MTKKPMARARNAAPVTAFIQAHFQHFNARTTVEAADAYKALVAKGGTMFVAMAGAMSTGELGRSLAEMIRRGYVGGMSVTGANLEESVMNLIGKPSYQRIPKYRDLTPQDEQSLYDAGLNRVTDTAIPDEAAMLPLVHAVLARWQAADAAGIRQFPHEFLYDVLLSGELQSRYADDPKNCWLLAAAQAGLPIVVPGWEDSTLGNAFAAYCLNGAIRNPDTVRSGIEYMMDLAGWYAQASQHRPIGFFQIGGGIAGDFPICVVPMLWEELHQEVPRWAYFCQITDAVTSYGGYSGALPNEKITWGKLEPDTPSFAIDSDASIVAPLIFAQVLGW